MALFFVLLSLVLVNAQRNIVRTISDVHIGSYWNENSQNHARFFSFLDTMTDPNTNVSKLILLGDFVELWLVPYQHVPKNWSEVIMENNPVFGINMTQFRESLLRIADNNVSVVMLWGNHDLEQPTDQEFSNAFNDHPNIMKANTSYLWMNVLYEHGHYYDLFNVPFPPQSSLSNLLYPFGYYVSRAAAQTQYNAQSLTSIQHATWVSKFADWIVTELKNQDNMELVLWALVDIPDPSLITDGNTLLVHGDPTNMTKNITFNQVIPMYNNMVNEWINLKGEDYTSAMLVAATTYDVDYFVQLQPQNVAIHIMGHTHHAALKRLNRQNSSPIIYANSGAWVDSAQNTWVDVIYNGSTPMTVQVGSYASGYITIVGSCGVNPNSDCRLSAAWNLGLGPWSFMSFILTVIYFTFLI